MRRIMLISVSTALVIAATLCVSGTALAIDCKPLAGGPSNVYVSVLDLNAAAPMARRLDPRTCAELGANKYGIDTINRAPDGSGYWSLSANRQTLTLVKRSIPSAGRVLRKIVINRALPSQRWVYTRGTVQERFGRLWVSLEAASIKGRDYRGLIIASARSGKLQRRVDGRPEDFMGPSVSFSSNAAWFHRSKSKAPPFVRFAASDLASLTYTPPRAAGATSGELFLLHDSVGSYLLDTYASTVTRFDAQTGSVVARYAAPELREDKYSGVNEMTTDISTNGTIWMGVGDGVAEFDVRAGRIVRRVATPGQRPAQVGFVGGLVLTSNYSDNGDTFDVLALDPASGEQRIIASVNRPHCCMPGPPWLGFDTGDPRETLERGYFMH